jgi:geranylgeranyl pyrophosphate synthase
MPSKNRGASIKKVFKLNGQKALEKATESLQEITNDNSQTSQALTYFSEKALQKALPIFPALITMSCKAIGGDTAKTVPIGEAIIFISAAADLHDDVIDQSMSKGEKQTVLGKFGVPISILSGDILIAKGYEKLNNATKTLPAEQTNKIFRLVSDAIVEICNAEAIETRLSRRLDLTPEAYFEIIKRKAVVPELAMQLGAIIGGGSASEIEALGQFGRAYGVISIIIEDLADLLNLEEMKNRLINECPPLPLIYSLQNSKLKQELMPLLSSPLNPKSHRRIVEIVLNSEEMQTLHQYLMKETNDGIKGLPQKIDEKIREELTNLLLAPLDCFEDG